MVIKQLMMRWAGNVAFMKEKTSEYRVLVEKPE
jgi:hypothetical protein